MYFHFQGFVEPDRSDMADLELSNVQADSAGTIYFEWDEANPNNTSWGSISGYRVLYSTSSVILDNIYQAATYVDTTDQFIELTNLNPGRYYYIKVIAIRQTSGGKTYLSDIIKPVNEVVIPPEGYFYDYGQGIIVSKDYSDGSGPDAKAAGEEVCGNDTVALSKNGITTNRSMKLINSTIFAIIESDPNLSSYSISSVPHWMSDDPINIAAIFGGASFDCSQQSGNNGANTYYVKSCSDCSCNELSVVRGGTPPYLPPDSVYYVDEDNMNAFFRCYVEQ